MDTVIRIVPAIVIILGLGLITIGVIDLAGTLKFRMSAEAATATVLRVEVDINHFEDGGSAESYRPVVTFQGADGQAYEATSPVSAQQYDFDPGDEIEIYYDPKAPSDIRIVGFVSSFLFPIVLAVMGLFTLAMSLIARWAIKDGRRRA